MSPATYIPIIVLWIIIFIMLRSRKTAIVRKIIQKRKMEGNPEMKELAKRFIDKECLIDSFNSNQMEGIIREVSDSAILVEKSASLEAINLDFVIRIREFPRNKKGKKKSAVFD